MTASESLASLGVRLTVLVQQAENSGTLVTILAGQLRRQRKAIEEIRAVINAGQGPEAAEAASVPIKVLTRANSPGD